MKISSYKTALEPGPTSSLDIPPSPTQELYLATYLHTLATELAHVIPHISIEAQNECPLEDIFHFGMLWDYLCTTYPDPISLCQQILDRRAELIEQKSSLKKYIELHTDISFARTVEKTLLSGLLTRAKDGAGSAYYLYDETGAARFVVKPLDEDIFCLNNTKNVGSPLNDKSLRVRDYIPLYRSAQTDTLAYLVAQHMEMDSITPKTFMMIIQSPSFYDVSESLCREDRSDLLPFTGLIDKEKACSVQEYVEDSTVMHQMIYKWLQEGKTEEEISAIICTQDFEMANLFIWTCFDSDAHLGNFLLYPKENGLYGIKKVDNGLSFPEKNTQMKNFLTFFTKAKTLLSPEMKHKIQSIPQKQILESMQTLCMSLCAQDAFIERCQLIQSLAKKEGMTIYEMNLRLLLLGTEENKNLALDEMNIEDIEKLIGIKTTSTTED